MRGPEQRGGLILTMAMAGAIFAPRWTIPAESTDRLPRWPGQGSRPGPNSSSFETNVCPCRENPIQAEATRALPRACEGRPGHSFPPADLPGSHRLCPLTDRMPSDAFGAGEPRPARAALNTVLERPRTSDAILYSFRWSTSPAESLSPI